MTDLQGQGIEKMTDQTVQVFKAAAMERFVAATADLPKVLFPPSQDLDRLVWHLTPPEHVSCNTIGTYRLRTADLMEANLERGEWLAFAAAAWPDVEFFIRLMGEYTFGNGTHSLPCLEIAVRVNDGKCFEALTNLDRDLCLAFERLLHVHGAQVTVLAVEGALDDQDNPVNFSRAVVAAVDAAREAAQDDGFEIAQAIEVQLILDSRFDVSAGELEEALRLMGWLFAFCDVQARYG